MVVITPRRCKEANLDIILIKNSDLFWMYTRDIRKNLWVTNMSNLVLKQIKGYFDTKKPTNE